MAQTVVYEDTQKKHQKVNMKIKSTGRGAKVQELFCLSNGNQVCGVFDGGKMSILGGAPLVYMVEQVSHYVEGAAACIKDWRMAYISRKSKAPKEIVLDFDGSCVPVHGDQQGTSYRKYYDTNMYFPLFVYDEDGWLICAILRPGRDGEARLTVPVLKRLVKALRTAWSHVRIIVRVDAAFGAQALYDWCEDQGKDDERDVVYYIVCLKAPADGRGVSVAFKQMRAEAGKLEYKALEGDKFSCREFTANQARLIFHALAYNTMYQLRESLPGARHSWSFQTIQKYLIRMATKISKKGNEIVMHWASDFQWKRIYN